MISLEDAIRTSLFPRVGLWSGLAVCDGQLVYSVFLYGISIEGSSRACGEGRCEGRLITFGDTFAKTHGEGPKRRRRERNKQVFSAAPQ